MAWWKKVLKRVKEGDVLYTPGRGMAGLNKKPFAIARKDSGGIRILSGQSRVPLERKCFDIIEVAFEKDPLLQLFVATIHEKPPLKGSADELIRHATGSDLWRGNYICSILEYCGLVRYTMKGSRKAIELCRKQ